MTPRCVVPTIFPCLLHPFMVSTSLLLLLSTFYGYISSSMTTPSYFACTTADQHDESFPLPNPTSISKAAPPQLLANPSVLIHLQAQPRPPMHPIKMTTPDLNLQGSNPKVPIFRKVFVMLFVLTHCFLPMKSSFGQLYPRCPRCKGVRQESN